MAFSVFEEFARNASKVEFLHSGDNSATTNISFQEQRKATNQVINAQKSLSL